jgi:uncharacterized membrane protein YfcA
VKPDPRYGYFAGFLGGAVGGVLSTGGPFVLVFYDSLDMDKRRFKATIMFYYIILILYKIPFFYVTGLLTMELWQTLIYYMPAVAVGTAGGMIAFRHVSERLFRLIILALLALFGMVMLIK